MRDNLVEDGDVLKVETNGFNTVVYLTNSPQTLTIPAFVGQQIRVVGVKDGGGGITATVVTTSGDLGLPSMNVGQVVPFTVR